MRVEQALNLLPDAEALAPLRDLLLASAHTDDTTSWGGAAPYLTVAKRNVGAEELRKRLPEFLERVGEHVAALYGAYAAALGRQDEGRPADAVAELVRGGRLEESVGRLAAARAWYAVALSLAEGLQDRRPEVETLQRIAALCAALGRHIEAARLYQRSLALAEAEFDHNGVIVACGGLGNAAMEQGDWTGGAAWLNRGLRQAEVMEDSLLAGQLRRQLGILAHRSGDLAAAGDHLRRARDRFEPLGDASEMARTLDAQGRVEAGMGRYGAALASYREALAWARRSKANGVVESGIRLHFAELLLEMGRALDAQEEVRRAEQLAIAHHASRRLVRIYVLMGVLRGREGDETGFIFFEQALALCRTFDRTPALEAEVYHQYGQFKHRLGEAHEAVAFLERARELFEEAGGGASLERVRAELAELSA